MRDRQDKPMLPQLELPSKPDDIVMLERQGRSSQRQRSSDISNTGSHGSSSSHTASRMAMAMTAQNRSSPFAIDKRGASLPPSHLKPPRKNFGFSASLNRKDEANMTKAAEYSGREREQEQPTFLQQITMPGGSAYQRLSPARKRSLLPTPTSSPARATRPLLNKPFLNF